MERASELCEQVYERLDLRGVADPQPRDFARELLGLNQAHFQRTGRPLPLEVTSAAGWYLVPPFDR